MLTMDSSQLARVGSASFVQRMRTVLEQQFPADAAAMASPEFEPQVLALVRRAQAYGLRDEQSAALFVITAWLLGLDFDTRLPELQALLKRTDWLPTQKASALEAFTLNLLQKLDQAAGGAA